MGSSATLFAIVRERIWSLNRERWFRRVVKKQGTARVPGFFDAYPRFFDTSIIAPPDRINQRYRALIESNVDVIRGCRVLDLASHDGRWSFATYKAGAEYVLGIEARQHLVEGARDNVREYGVLRGQVEFRQGDAVGELESL